MNPVSERVNRDHYLHEKMAYVSRTRKPQVASPRKQTTELSLDDLRADWLKRKDELKKTLKEDTLENIDYPKNLATKQQRTRKTDWRKVEKRCKQIKEIYEKKLDYFDSEHRNFGEESWNSHWKITGMPKKKRIQRKFNVNSSGSRGPLEI